MIDCYASRPHYVDHLAPVWLGLPERLRGVFYAPGAYGADTHARTLGVDVGASAGTRCTLVAGYLDLKACRAGEVILMEHGAGQTYSDNNPGLAGGRGRERVRLFLCPNTSVAARNLERYCTPAVVVGCPRLDTLSTGRPDARTVALSWHWDNTSSPEARSAWTYYGDALPSIVAELRAAGVTILGHAHPRMMGTVLPTYQRLGIEPVHDFAEAVSRAAVYVCDNSSTMFEAAAIGRSVVVLNAPWYRRDVEHGLRFWELADLGPHVDEPSQLAAAILTALRDRPLAPDALLRRVYPHQGCATARAVRAIVDHLGD